VRGEAVDLPRIEGMINNATPIQGPGWSAVHAQTLGGVATRARDGLRRALGQRPPGAS
jgi:hypothetical protein